MFHLCDSHTAKRKAEKKAKKKAKKEAEEAANTTANTTLNSTVEVSLLLRPSIFGLLHYSSISLSSLNLILNHNLHTFLILEREW